MDKQQPVFLAELDFKIRIGTIAINVLSFSYVPPIPNWRFENHCHSSYELHFVKEGKGLLRVHNQDYAIGPGTFYLTGPGLFHEQRADADDPMSEYCLNMEIRVLKSARKKSDIYIEDEVNHVLNVLQETEFWFGRDEYGSVDLMHNIILEFENNLIGYYSYVQNLGAQIILNVIRNISLEQKSTYITPRKTLNDSRRFIVDNYFRSYEQELTPKELAQIIAVSERQLERVLIEYYGMTFKEKLTFTRLEEAKNLLLNTDMPIQQVADRIGFASVGYFNKVFQQCYQATPGRFRDHLPISGSEK